MYTFYKSNTFLALLVIINPSANVAGKIPNAIKIALNGSLVQYCFDVIITSTALFDGDKDTPYSITDKCQHTVLSVYSINLHNSSSVHYVILYDGSTSDLLKSNLDYFEVYLFSHKDKRICSDYPKVNRGLNPDGMRVNCKIYINQTHALFLESHYDKGFSLSEIEIYTFDNFEKDGPSIFYRGCFKNIKLDKIHDVKDFYDSIITCRQSQTTYVSFKNNTTFYCGNEYSDQLPDSQCDVSCSDIEYFCGGKNAYSVYVALVRLPLYVGCFDIMEFEKHELINWTTDYNMTISKCIIKCENYNFAALSNGTGCYCAQSLIKELLELHIGKKGSPNCNTSCSGNETNMCGGKEFLSIYTTCQHEFERLLQKMGHTKCTDLIRCASEMNEYGVCIGDCESGFYGEYCLHKISSVDNIKSTEIAATTTTTGVINTDECEKCSKINGSRCQMDDNDNISCACPGGYSLNLDNTCKKDDGDQSENSTRVTTTTTTSTSTATATATTTTPTTTTTTSTTTSTAAATITTITTTTTTTTTATTTKVTTTTTSVTTTNPNICISKKPCELYLNTECLVDPQNNYTCRCKRGYKSFEVNGKKQSCLDINECDFEPCDNKNSMCENVGGDFRCDCMDAHVRLPATDICISGIEEIKQESNDMNLVFILPATIILICILSLSVGWLYIIIKNVYRRKRRRYSLTLIQDVVIKL